MRTRTSHTGSNWNEMMINCDIHTALHNHNLWMFIFQYIHKVFFFLLLYDVRFLWWAQVRRAANMVEMYASSNDKVCHVPYYSCNGCGPTTLRRFRKCDVLCLYDDDYNAHCAMNCKPMTQIIVYVETSEYVFDLCVFWAEFSKSRSSCCSPSSIYISTD